MPLRKPRFAGFRPRPIAWFAALFGLCAWLLPIETARAQGECGNSLFVGGPVINPISGSKVIVGQTITITRFSMGSAVGSCLFRNGVGYYASPDGIVHQVLEDLRVDPDDTKNCPSDDGLGVTCLPFPTTYTVNAADLNRTITFVLPPRGAFGGSTVTYPGVTNELHFVGGGDIDGFDPNDPTTLTGSASGSSSARLVVVSPGLAISQECDSNCFPYGSSIGFHGTICNTGDISFINMTVAVTPGGPASFTSPITFASTTSLGNPFNPATGLSPGECIDYSGSYQPAGTGAALCGPFTSKATATGTAQGVFQNPTYSATNSATCNVCPSPFCAPSVTLLNPTIVEGSFSFSFPTEAERNYTIEFNDSLLSTDWQTLATLTGNGAIATAEDTMANPRRFYRVKME